MLQTLEQHKHLHTMCWHVPAPPVDVDCKQNKAVVLLAKICERTELCLLSAPTDDLFLCTRMVHLHNSLNAYHVDENKSSESNSSNLSISWIMLEHKMEHMFNLCKYFNTQSHTHAFGRKRKKKRREQRDQKRRTQIVILFFASPFCSKHCC